MASEAQQLNNSTFSAQVEDEPVNDLAEVRSLLSEVKESASHEIVKYLAENVTSTATRK